MAGSSIDVFEELAINGGTKVRSHPLPWELPGAYWIDGEELEAVGKVIRAKSPFRYYGLDLQRMVEKLEASLKQVLGRKHALGVGSGTAALSAAFAALGVGPGDEVLIPGYLWVSCISGIVRQGAIPRLVDIDDTFCMDPEDMEKKITPHTKAVLLVHMSGTTGRLDKLMAVARSNGLKVVEDCAQANGGSFFGKPLGSFGDIAIFSFQLNKNMTSGEGGAIVCDDDELFNRIYAIHDLGYARNEAGRLDTANEQYQLWGLGTRMSELAGAMALVQFGKLPKIVHAMRSAKWAIRDKLSDISGIQFRTILDPAGDSGPFLITLFENSDKCEKFCSAIAAEGIEGHSGSMAFLPMSKWGLHWYFNNQSLVKKRSLSSDGFPWTHPLNAFANGYSYSKGALPVCDDFASRGALLTIASCLSEQDVEDIARAFIKVAEVVL